MPEIGMIEDSHAAEEDAAAQAAYVAWVVQAREKGRNGENDIFAAGWAAGRDWAQAERRDHA